MKYEIRGVKRDLRKWVGAIVDARDRAEAMEIAAEYGITVEHIVERPPDDASVAVNPERRPNGAAIDESISLNENAPAIQRKEVAKAHPYEMNQAKKLQAIIKQLRASETKMSEGDHIGVGVLCIFLFIYPMFFLRQCEKITVSIARRVSA